MEKVNINKLVAMWLNRVLTDHYKSMKVDTFDSGKTILSRLIADLGLEKLFPQSNAWDVKIDVTGIIQTKTESYLALVDFTPRKLTLSDVAIMFGYARVANPVLCMLISPQPPVDPLITLLKDYGRLDILKYGPSNRFIRIAKWDTIKNEVIPASLLPPGSIL